MKSPREALVAVVEMAGVALILVGLALIWLPLALIGAGLVLIVAAFNAIETEN